ncbi:sigma-70 family RNA polymerase sigma factor [Patulibacter sp. SYSU D01012]|uniref:RNA polymerase sigma factor n=1 Tax=Patulibacter sp. SYSU D01012 TaxID=2817381 RepID=UPI001FEFE755|nr:sigma-70 family RNA polymerase sigma factor [Patulibacter sp. SYSU D01012]
MSSAVAIPLPLRPRGAVAERAARARRLAAARPRKLAAQMAPPPEHLTSLSDGELLARVAKTDPEAFEVLYDRMASPAFGLAYRIVGAKAAADDVCQEAFLSVWRSAARYDARLGNPRSWVLAVVRNRAIDHLRRHARTKEREVGDEALAERHPAPQDQGTEAQALRRTEAADTRELMNELSDDQRQVIELSFYGGLSHSEIASKLELPLGTVKARMNRGLARMRKHLADGSPA